MAVVSNGLAPLAPRVDGSAGDDVLVGQNNVRNVIYGNAGNDILIGGNVEDVLVGDAGADTLSGNDGNDSLWGGGGGDSLSGGEGDDKLFGDGGNDTLDGDAGNDILDGGDGDDLMRGGIGNDTYIVASLGDQVIENAGEGIDTVLTTVSYTLGANLENLTLTGNANIDGTGNESNNVISGNSGNNVLNGGAGQDTMAGGAGNDTYYTDTAADVVIENAGEGVDTVYASINYTAGANVENIVLTGASALVANGNALDNVLTGNDLANNLTGADGADVLNGGGGNDAMNGGAGTDTIYGGTGNDGVYAGGSNDVIYGEDGNDKIYGDGGNDWISGGAGNDVLIGGMQKNGFSLGNDTFSWMRSDVINAAGTVQGFDHIVDFGAGDKLDFSGLTLTAGPVANVVQFTDTTAGTVISANFGGSAGFVDVVVLDGVHGITLNDMVIDHAIVV